MSKNLYTQSGFARLAEVSRQNISALIKKGILVLNEDNKLDSSNPINAAYLVEREINPRMITNPGKIKSEKIKKEPVKKVPQKTVTKKTVVKKEPAKNKTTKKDDEEEEFKKLAKESTRAKYKKEIFLSQKAEMDLKKSRAELAELDTIGKTCIGYCIALNQNLLDQPRSWIDNVEAAIKNGKSKTDITDIARKPEMMAIEHTIEMIKKELARYKRDIKSDNK